MTSFPQHNRTRRRLYPVILETFQTQCRINNMSTFQSTNTGLWTSSMKWIIRKSFSVFLRNIFGLRKDFRIQKDVSFFSSSINLGWLTRRIRFEMCQTNIFLALAKFQHLGNNFSSFICRFPSHCWDEATCYYSGNVVERNYTDRRNYWSKQINESM